MDSISLGDKLGEGSEGAESQTPPSTLAWGLGVWSCLDGHRRRRSGFGGERMRSVFYMVSLRQCKEGGPEAVALQAGVQERAGSRALPMLYLLLPFAPSFPLAGLMPHTPSPTSPRHTHSKCSQGYLLKHFLLVDC